MTARRLWRSPPLETVHNMHGTLKIEIRITQKVTFVTRWLFEQGIAVGDLGKYL